MLLLEEEKEQLKNYDGKDRVLHCEDIQAEIKERLSVEPVVFIKSKIPKLDDILNGGFKKGQLVVMGGETGKGKTSMLVNLTYRFAEQNKKSLWLSYEMPYEDLFEKFNWTELPLPEFYLPRRIQDKDMVWLRKRVIESVVKYKADILFIDHLHSLLPFACQDEQREIANRVRLLKALALELNIVIFMAVHTRRALEDIVPTEKDLKGSTTIGDEADIILFIWRRTLRQTKAEKESEGIKYAGNQSVLWVAKSRRSGRKDYVPLIYSNQLFTEMSYEYKEDPF